MSFVIFYSVCVRVCVYVRMYGQRYLCIYECMHIGMHACKKTVHIQYTLFLTSHAASNSIIFLCALPHPELTCLYF